MTICSNPRCLDPDHRHPDPSPVQRAVASLSPADLALWCALVAGNALHVGERIIAGQCLLTALRASRRGDPKTDSVLRSILRWLEIAGNLLLRDRHGLAEEALLGLIAEHGGRADEIKARLDAADAEMEAA